jgi:hypothetical protein
MKVLFRQSYAVPKLAKPAVTFGNSTSLTHWRQKIDPELEKVFDNWLKTKKDTSIPVLVTLRDKVVINRALENMMSTRGLKIQSKLSAIGLITGNIKVSQLERLARMKEVDFLEEEKTNQVSS